MRNDLDKAAYQLWYAFLKRSVKNRWSADMKFYFKDIETVPFKTWWLEYEEIVEKVTHSGVDEMKTVKDFKDYNDQRGVIVWVDLSQPKEKLMNALGDLIDRVMPTKSVDLPKKKRGRPKFEDCPNSLDLGLAVAIKENNILALKKMLKVYDACIVADAAKARGGAYESRYDIGKRLGVAGAHVWEVGDLNAKLKTRRMNATVSRYYKWADEVIRNAEQGIFPKHS